MLIIIKQYVAKCVLVFTFNKKQNNYRHAAYLSYRHFFVHINASKEMVSTFFLKNNITIPRSAYILCIYVIFNDVSVVNGYIRTRVIITQILWFVLWDQPREDKTERTNYHQNVYINNLETKHI